MQRLEAEVEADGLASFSGVIGDREVIYTLSAAYRDIRFFSNAYISSIEREGPLELIVFETTADPSVIRIIGDSSAITPPADDSGVLRVLQVTTFENVSDRAYVGNDPLNTRLTVVLPLPTMAFDLESVHSPGSLVLAPGGPQCPLHHPCHAGDRGIHRHLRRPLHDRSVRMEQGVSILDGGRSAAGATRDLVPSGLGMD